jgi:DNA-binding transcriptional LysR family regulator
LNFAAVETFLTIVSSKSISKAADNLHLSQSTVSLQMKSLEAELGVSLFERHKGHRQIELTQKGSDFVSIAERLVQICKEAHSLQYEHKLSLSVSSVDSLNLYTFLPFYRQMVHAEKPMALRIFTHQSSEIYEQVENRTVDVGLVLKQISYPNIITKPLFKEKMQLVFSPMFDVPTEQISPNDLDFEQEIFFNWGPEFEQWHAVWCNPNKSPTVQVDNVTMARHFLLEGKHWSILPSSVLREFQMLAPIRTYPMTETPPDRVCYKLTHRFPKKANMPSIQLFEMKIDEFVQKLCLQNIL